MNRALLVTVRLHEGRYHGLDEQQRCQWPPAPARLFQALMAGAAASPEEDGPWTAALDWLETLDPPAIAAPRAKKGVRYQTYVPNNDVDAALPKEESYEEAVKKTLLAKRIQPMLFNPDCPIVYRWDIEAEDQEQAETVCKIAHELYQLGRTVDMAYANAAVVDAKEADRQCHAPHLAVHRPSGDAPGGKSLWCPRPGLRQSLTTSFDARQHRLQTDESTDTALTKFVHEPKPQIRMVRYGARQRLLVFDIRGADTGAYAPWPIERTATLIGTVRDEAADHLAKATPNNAQLIARYLTGRSAKADDKRGRVQIIPIPSTGHPHSDHLIRRLAVRIPPYCELPAEELAWAFDQVAWKSEGKDLEYRLDRTESSDVVRRFEKRSTHWRSSTPLALPLRKNGKRSGPSEGKQITTAKHRTIEEQKAVRAVLDALRHADVHEKVDRIVVQRSATDRCEMNAQAFADHCRFERRTLWHVSFACHEGLEGPLVLGDGRYVGLGLMRPVLESPSILEFSITDGLNESTAPKPVAIAARRAMMARVQAQMRSDARLPTYVSGHRADGRPAGGNGRHEHIAVVADLPRRRILFMAPSEIDRRNTSWSQLAAVHAHTATALRGMDILHTREGDRLKLRTTQSDPETDPLFRPSRTWQSVTPYYVTRHHKRMTPTDAVKRDVRDELARCGWPRVSTDQIEILETNTGIKGALSAQVRITFQRAEPGPLLIGRTAHKGGGLLAGTDEKSRVLPTP